MKLLISILFVFIANVVISQFAYNYSNSTDKITFMAYDSIVGHTYYITPNVEKTIYYIQGIVDSTYTWNEIETEWTLLSQQGDKSCALVLSASMFKRTPTYLAIEFFTVDIDTIVLTNIEWTRSDTLIPFIDTFSIGDYHYEFLYEDKYFPRTFPIHEYNPYKGFYKRTNYRINGNKVVYYFYIRPKELAVVNSNCSGAILIKTLKHIITVTDCGFERY